MTDEPIAALLVDDQELVRSGLRCRDAAKIDKVLFVVKQLPALGAGGWTCFRCQYRVFVRKPLSIYLSI